MGNGKKVNKCFKGGKERYERKKERQKKESRIGS